MLCLGILPQRVRGYREKIKKRKKKIKKV